MSDDFAGSRAFLSIPVGIARDKDLLDKPKSILLMGEIVSMLNVTGEFFMSNSAIAKRLKCTPRTIRDYLSLLESKNLIKRVNVFDEDNPKQIKGRKITAGSALGKYISLGWGDTKPKGKETDLPTLRLQIATKKNSINRTVNRTDKDINSSSKDEPSIPYKKVINYLNQKAGTHYSSTTKPTQRLIRARWHEGYRLDDFKKVVDNKAFEWQSDSKMWKYMRPATLFGSKFDDYLNANDLSKHQNQPASGGYDTTPVDLTNVDDSDLPF